jgi:hypothetical protein
MPKQADPAQHSLNVVQADWPELGEDWEIQTETVPYTGGRRPSLVLARFKTAATRTPQFVVGTECRFGPRRGLALSIGAPYYRAAEYVDRPKVHHWAHIIEPTAKVEGEGSFAALNTYDNASFTFGFLQFSAKNYKANLHTLLLRLFDDAATKASHFLPKLKVKQGELYGEKASGGLVQLTSRDRKENDELRRYLKPEASRVTEAEIEFGARFVYWTRFFLKSHHHQVELAVDELREKILALDKKRLDKKSDRVFAWLVDMYNQGAPPRKELVAALEDADPEVKLEALKSQKHPARAARLKKLIHKSTAFGLLYDAASETFKKPEGP